MLDNVIDFTDLPAPPESLLAVIRYCSEEDTSTEDLANLIKGEPALTAELLKIVNSAYYGFVSEITSVDRMTVMMGLKAIRSLALCIAMRNITSENIIEGFDDKLYREDAIRRAVISSVLGKQLNFDVDECFTAGLLQDIGLLVLFLQKGEHHEFAKSYRHYNPDLRAILEQDEFSITHNEVAEFLSSEWSLPATLVQAIAGHHQEKAESIQLQNILYCTDWLNALLTMTDKAGIYLQCMQQLTAQLDLSETQIKSLIETLPAEVASVAEAFGYQMNADEDLTEVLKHGSKKLAEDNLELQELTWRLKRTITERDKLSAELHREVEFAQEVQAALLPDYDDKLPFHGFNVPAKDLSGDFYDYFKTSEHQIHFCLGDVSGKGVHASLLMVKISSLFRVLCTSIDAPELIAEKMNDELCRVVVRGMFVTLVLGVYDMQSGKVKFVGAGHLPVLYINAEGECTAYASKSLPLGIIKGEVFSSEVINIAKGSLYMYSDGITEAKLNSDKMIEVEGLALLLQRLHDKPAGLRLKVLLSFFKKNQKELHDDTTMLLLDGTAS